MTTRVQGQGNLFAGGSIERLTECRGDHAWLAARLAAADARILPVNGHLNLVYRDTEHPHAALLVPDDVTGGVPDLEQLIFLGRFRKTFCFALPTTALPTEPAGVEFADLRRVAPLLDAEEAALLAYARAMTHWNSEHRYCGRCGLPTRALDAGHTRVCTGTECGHRQFPRTDPAIIVLVEYDNRCLLGRQPEWPEDRYSTIAGFVEPGESLEDAVAREVLEETGISVHVPDYHSSQPWPFPASLMLGFTARALDSRVQLRDGELADARWFSRQDIVSGLHAGSLLLPTPFSISRRLIVDWFDAGSNIPLANLSE